MDAHLLETRLSQPDSLRGKAGAKDYGGETKAEQATEKLAALKGRSSLKGTGFSPYITAAKSVGFSP